EGQLSDAVAVFVGVAILPELLLQVLALAGCVHEPPGPDRQPERRRLQVAEFPAEVIAHSRITDERAIHGCRSCKNLACRQIRPALLVESAGRRGFYNSGNRGWHVRL